MATPSERSTITSIGLIAAIAVPILYFGSQLLAAPFYPGYSFAQNSASMLGSSFSAHPWIFNVGAMLTGVAAILGAFGLYRAFQATANTIVAWPIGLAVFATGIMSLKAGIFPLPDPRHASWGFLVTLTIVTPLLLLIGVWKKRGSNTLRLYLIASVSLVLVLFPFMSGMASTSLLQGGTLQRLFAIATFVPVGAVGYSLKKGALVLRDER